MLHPAILRRRRAGVANPLNAYRAGGSVPNVVADFITGKYLGTLETVYDLAYTAGSHKTMMDSAGLLRLEPHNLARHSGDLTAWSAGEVSVALSGDTVDGLPMYRLTDTAASASHQIWTQTETVAGQVYTLAFIAKADGVDEITTYGASGLSATAKVNMTTGAVTIGTGTVTALSNGFYYFEINASSSTTGVNVLYIRMGPGSYAGTEKSVIVGAPRLVRRDVPAANAPARSDTFVSTGAASKILPRVGHYLRLSGEWTLGGVLLEPAGTNLLTYSRDITQWTKFQTATLVADATGLDGETSAVTVVDDSGGGTGSVAVWQSVTVATSTPYVFSVAAKADGLDGIMMFPNAFTAVAGLGRYFNVATGEIGGTYAAGGSTGLTPAIQDLGDYCLPSLTFTSHTSDTTGEPQIYLADVSGTETPAVARDGTSSVVLTDAQFEAGKIPTSRIVTNGATATRAADQLGIAAADAPGHFWAMSGYLTYADNGLAEEQVLFLREVDASNLMKVTLDTSGANTGTITLTVITAGTTVTLSTTADLTPGLNTPFHIAFGATGTEIALAMGGASETRVASGLPDLSAADVEIPMHGTLSRLIGYADDIGDTGLEEASSISFFRQASGLYDADLNHVFVYGQSLSLGWAPPLSTAPAYDHLMFYRGLRPQYDYIGETAAEWYASLVPMVEAVGETPTRGALDTIKERIAAEEGWLFTDHRYQFVGSNPGKGATAIAGLSKGTEPFSRMVEQATYAKALADAAGDSYAVQAVCWIQGTTDYLLHTTYAAHLASLNTLVADIQADLMAETGQTKRIAVIGAQTANHRAAAADDLPDIALAQLDCHIGNANFYLACPTYHLPYADQYHPNAEGERWLGAQLGLVYKRVVIDGLEWEPVRPISNTVAGTTWDVTFAVQDGLALEWDTTTVPAQANYGFELVDSGDTPLTISDVSITGDATVRITAAASIPSGAKLRYAWQGNTNQGLGNLRDNQGDTITHQTKRLDNWAVIFEEVNA